jgi:hypothetical protein
MTLRADETELVGRWKSIDGRMIGDEVSTRVETLVRDELKPIAVSADGWERLFEDPRDHRLWELTYPLGETHGGGPPSLRAIDQETVRRKYKL